MHARVALLGLLVLLAGCDDGPDPPEVSVSDCPDRDARLGQDSMGHVPYFADVEEMVVASDLVVVGTVVQIDCDDRIDVNAASTMRRTVVEVEEVLHGEAPDRVVLGFLGDGVGGPVADDGVLPPFLGEQAVWMLRAGTLPDGSDGLTPIGPQGRYLVDGDRLRDVVPESQIGAGVASEVALGGLDRLREQVAEASVAVAEGRLAATWTGDPDDRILEVTEARGSGHCNWHETRFLRIHRTRDDGLEVSELFLAAPTAAVPFQNHALATEDAPLTYAPDAELPSGAVDTGWRRGSVELWLEGAPETADHAYLVHPDRVERLPHVDDGFGCD